MNPLRNVGAQLSLALLLVVAGALTLVYLVVIPSLESRLIDGKIRQVRLSVRSSKSAALSHEVHRDPLWFSDQQETSNQRFVFYTVLTERPELALSVDQDSRGGKSSADVENDPIALRASAERDLESGTVSHGGERYAEAAFGYADGRVLLVSAPLSDTLGAVSVARQRLLLAGGIVLALVLVVGYCAAWFFARRIRRLEQAAERIASGRFDEPIVDSGDDELGNLARAFDHMRQRLALLDRARREFIANASHELRTPLFSLAGFLELLDDEELEPNIRREFLATMRDQVDRLTKLAGELLDLTKLDAGQIHIASEPVSLVETARVVSEEFAAVARRLRHRLEVEADEDALATGDEQRVVQIARILVENALVHTPPDTAIRVRVARDDVSASLSVEDDGPGISPEQADHVFERFYRSDGGQAFGSGLGLAIGQELARAMGGTLELESGPGRTCFTLTLPSADTVDDTAEPPREPVEV
jgi:signal transduction histidine kinase